MKLRLKKIIAREFLLLTLTLLIGVLVFCGSYLYNLYQQYRIESIGDEIAIKQLQPDSLATAYDQKIKKHELFYDKFAATYDMGEYDVKKWWARFETDVKNDSLVIKWRKQETGDKDDQEWIKHFNQIGFNNPFDLQKFILDNKISERDSSNKALSEMIKKEIYILRYTKIDKEKNILTIDDRIDLLIKTIFILLAILFGIRYLIYAIRWSISVLKEKNE